MKGKNTGLYCTTREAAAVLGMFPEDLRRKLKSGALVLGEIERHKTRVEFKIEREKVLALAGLTEWPDDVDTTTAADAAAEAGRILKETGMDAEAIAEILESTGCITKPMGKRMKEVGEYDD